MRCEYDNDNLKQFIRRVQMHKRSPSPTPVVPSANAPVVSGSGAALAPRRGGERRSRRHHGAPDTDSLVRWDGSRGRPLGQAVCVPCLQEPKSPCFQTNSVKAMSGN
jgi:hypothetical protein